MKHALEPTNDPAWVFCADGYDPLRESSVESRFAISNGFLGVRGGRATTRGARWVVPALTYLAGLFDTPDVERATPGLIPAADWLHVRILLPDGPVVHHPGDVSSQRMTLDVRRGALLSESRRLAWASDRHNDKGQPDERSGQPTKFKSKPIAVERMLAHIRPIGNCAQSW
jgi:trehalose/maltose hydrolase-like predicted phosphorylase